MGEVYCHCFDCPSKEKKLQMSKYITREQRYAISMMLKTQMSKKEIAKALGVDKSTIYREIDKSLFYKVLILLLIITLNNCVI